MLVISICKSCISISNLNGYKWRALLFIPTFGHTPPSQVFSLHSLCTYIFHTSGGILKKKICFFGFPDKAVPCKCSKSWIKPPDANCFHAQRLWLILRVFRSQIESIYPRLKEDYAFDCASACRCGNHPTISKNLDANHLDYKGKGLSVAGRSSGRRARPLCTRIPFERLLWPFFKCQLRCCEQDKLSAWADTRRARKHMLLFFQSPSFIWCLWNTVCMWMSAHSAVTFRLSHCN